MEQIPYILFAAAGVALTGASYLCLILRTFSFKRLFWESFILCFIGASGAFYFFPFETSFLTVLGSGGIVAAVLLYLLRRVARGVEDKYDEARSRRGEKLEYEKNPSDL